MSFKTPKVKPTPTPPDPRDEESRLATNRMRQLFSGRGRSSTILTRFMQRGAGSAPVRTIVGGGG